ncbi:MAG: hypothetical protein Q7S74_05070 [Nanoarchaeota archaeon]|nr:hypothetical protein [Nanoarchaeota archaeon]
MESIKRKVNLNIFMMAVVLAALLFLSGILVGDYLAYKKLDEIKTSQKVIGSLFDLFILKTANINKQNVSYCDLKWEDVWKEKVEIGEILSRLETRLGKNDEKVMEQKDTYNKIQIKILNITEETKAHCDYNWNIILFFYTNNKNDPRGDYQLSEQQGYVLDTIYNVHNEKVRIFTFDMSSKNNITDYLTGTYNISSLPHLVINGKSYGGFMNRNEIEKALQ